MTLWSSREIPAQCGGRVLVDLVGLVMRNQAPGGRQVPSVSARGPRSLVVYEVPVTEEPPLVEARCQDTVGRSTQGYDPIGL